jgi:hypothetical protein
MRSLLALECRAGDSNITFWRSVSFLTAVCEKLYLGCGVSLVEYPRTVREASY